MNFDKIFVDWNKATIKSFEEQIASNSSESDFYKNRLIAFKLFIDIDNAETVKATSIRYSFLQALPMYTNKKDFYVVEVVHSGEQVEIKNYVIYPTSKSTAEVDRYNFIAGSWVKKIASKKIKLDSDFNIKKDVTTFGLGFNQDDLIVTKFIDNKVHKSDFYLFTTLSSLSTVKRVLM